MAKTKDRQIHVDMAIAGIEAGFEVWRLQGRDGLSELFEYHIEFVQADWVKSKIKGSSGDDQDKIDVEYGPGKEKGKDIHLAEFIDRDVRLCITGPNGVKRWINGIIDRIYKVDSDAPKFAYAAVIVPRAKRLTLARDCRIFQHRHLEDILKTIFDENGIDFEFNVQKKDFKARTYCVQYRESTWNFISRLLAEEGYTFYFDHTEISHKIVMTNDSMLLPSITKREGIEGIKDLDGELIGRNDDAIRYGVDPSEEYISSLNFYHQRSFNAATLNDYNYEYPRASLLRQSLIEPLRKRDRMEDYPRYNMLPENTIEYYDFPSAHLSPQEGAVVDTFDQHSKEAQLLSSYRLDSLRATDILGRGEAYSSRLQAGRRFRLVDYPLKEPDFETTNHNYLLVRTTLLLENESGEYGTNMGSFSLSASFECIPEWIPYRPPVIERPTVMGLQTATVMGPEKEEIYVDKQGRIKVRFHWDRRFDYLDQLKRSGDKTNRKALLQMHLEENCTCWIRVSQSWAGSDRGFFYTPRVGDEVIISCIEGDPDRPIVTGSLYNDLNRSSINTPRDRTQSTIKTKSTPNGGPDDFNELRFEDRKGSEEVYLQAQRNLRELVKSDMSTSVGHDQSLSVGHDRKVTVKNDETLNVEVNQWETIGGIRDLKVTGNDTQTYEASQTITVADAQSIKVMRGDRKIEVETGDQLILVKQGDRKVTVSTGDETTIIKGQRDVVVQEGEESINIQKGDRVVRVGTGDQRMNIKGDFQTDVGSNYSLNAKKIEINASDEIVLAVGPSKVTLTPAGVEITGPTIKSTAMGKHDITGAIIKIN